MCGAPSRRTACGSAHISSPPCLLVSLRGAKSKYACVAGRCALGLLLCRSGWGGRHGLAGMRRTGGSCWFVQRAVSTLAASHAYRIHCHKPPCAACTAEHASRALVDVAMRAAEAMHAAWRAQVQRPNRRASEDR